MTAAYERPLFDCAECGRGHSCQVLADRCEQYDLAGEEGAVVHLEVIGGELLSDACRLIPSIPTVPFELGRRTVIVKDVTCVGCRQVMAARPQLANLATAEARRRAERAAAVRANRAKPRKRGVRG